MNKAKLILGPPASGKSLKAMEIIQDYTNPVFFKGNETRLSFGLYDLDANEKTDIIIIEECGRNFDYIRYINYIKNGIIINQERKIIHPEFVFVSQYRPIGINASFLFYFEILELDILKEERELERSDYEDIEELLLVVFHSEYFIKKSANSIEIGYIEKNMYSLSKTKIIQEMKHYGWIRTSSYDTRRAVFYIFEKED